MRYLMVVLLACFVMTDFAEARGGHSSGGRGGIGHTRPSIDRNGHFRAGHFHTNPDQTKLNNWSTKGNTNPVTGKPGTKSSQ